MEQGGESFEAVESLQRFDWAGVTSVQAGAAATASVARVLLRPPHRRVDHMGMAAPVYYSAEMVRHLPDDGNRYETVHGELLVTPAPRAWHQVLVMRIATPLDQYLGAHSLGQVLTSPADISWGPHVLVQPDVFVVPLDEARTLTWSRMRTLLLAIEVLSPSTARFDRFTKRRLYQEVGVPLYWLVDGDDHAVEVWTPETTLPVVERERVTWMPRRGEAPFTLDLVELFRPI